MPENQLIVVEEQKNLFKRAFNNLSKTINISSNNFKSIMINVKRYQLIKNFRMYQNISNIPDEKKRDEINKKYDKAYLNYMTGLDTYITTVIYPKVQANKAKYDEIKLMEEYLMINNLKETDLMEYKYKRQRFLIENDFFNVLKSKNLEFVRSYKEFFVYKMDSIYKTILRTYSIKLMDKERYDGIYDEMFKELEEYIIEVLPYKIEINDANEYKNIIEEHKKLERFKYEVEIKDKVKYIEKNMLLLAISRDLFTYSLPLIVAEQCYIKLLKEAREAVTTAENFSRKEELYKLIINLIELYNIKLLSKKTYWDDPKLREEYKKFWNEYQRISKLENIDYSEYTRQKESLFIYYDLKLLNRTNNPKYEAVKEFYRIKLRELKGLRKLKNSYKTLDGKRMLKK